MKTVHVWIRSAPNAIRVLRFRKFPVRIGRGSPCECRLNVPLVSRLHATLDLQEGRLVLRDEGSRFGTRAGKDRKTVAANQWIDLATCEGEFAVGPVLFRAELQDEQAPASAVADSGDFETVALQKGGDATVQYAAAKVDPGALDASAQRLALRQALERRMLADEALSTLVTQLSTAPAAFKRQLASDVAALEPQWHAHRKLREFVESTGVAASPRSLEEVALRAVRDFSRRYAPQAPPLASAGDMESFVGRLDRALSTLIEGTAALRYAFLVETQGQPPNDPEKATLGAKLLDWTADPLILDALRDDLTEMLGHHRELVTEAASLLDRALACLNPSALEQRGPGAWNPLRHRGLWKEFRRRHEELLHHRTKPLGRALGAAAEALGLGSTAPAGECIGRAIPADFATA